MVFLQPSGVRLGRGQLRFDFFVRDNPSGNRIHQEHLTRLQAALLEDLFRRNRQYTRLGGHDDLIIAGDIVAAGTQAITIQHGADAAAIGKTDGGRPIPGFHQAGVILVKSAFFRTHPFVALPRFRHHHHHGMGQGITGHYQQLQAVIEHGRV